MSQGDNDFRSVHGVIQNSSTIRDAIETIDRSPYKIALVVDREQRLVGTITDGDVRRALLNGKLMDMCVTEIMYRTPVISYVDEPIEDAERLARRRAIRQVPIVDRNGCVVGIHVVDEATQNGLFENPVVLMAGGLGLRLRPLTEHAPKPLLSVGTKPMLETIVDQLIVHGFRKFFFAVQYKAEMVQDHFGDGSRWNAEFQYLHETEPLGTAGALGLLGEIPDLPLLVMNADLLTKIDYRHFLQFHEDSGVAATMAVRAYDIKIPYGVVSTDSHRILSIEEKPVQKFFVNAGIYVLEPDVLHRIEGGARLDMPDLFTRLIEAGLDTAAFPIREYWIDVGQMQDYHKANDEFKAVFE